MIRGLITLIIKAQDLGLQVWPDPGTNDGCLYGLVNREHEVIFRGTRSACLWQMLHLAHVHQS